jgi:hypothetical protein
VTPPWAGGTSGLFRLKNAVNTQFTASLLIHPAISVIVPLPLTRTLVSDI